MGEHEEPLPPIIQSYAHALHRRASADPPLGGSGRLHAPGAGAHRKAPVGHDRGARGGHEEAEGPGTWRSTRTRGGVEARRRGGPDPRASPAPGDPDCREAHAHPEADHARRGRPAGVAGRARLDRGAAGGPVRPPGKAGRRRHGYTLGDGAARGEVGGRAPTALQRRRGTGTSLLRPGADPAPPGTRRDRPAVRDRIAGQTPGTVGLAGSRSAPHARRRGHARLRGRGAAGSSGARGHPRGHEAPQGPEARDPERLRPAPGSPAADGGRP